MHRNDVSEHLSGYDVSNSYCRDFRIFYSEADAGTVDIVVRVNGAEHSFFNVSWD